MFWIKGIRSYLMLFTQSKIFSAFKSKLKQELRPNFLVGRHSNSDPVKFAISLFCELGGGGGGGGGHENF